jgi:hypothetical protein
VLAGLVGSVVAAGLLARGAWDAWAQALLILALVAGVAVWACARSVHGRFPLPDRRLLRWLALLAALAALSSARGPLAAYSWPAWAALAAGLALWAAASALDARGRERAESLLRGAAWALVLLALHQRLHGESRPPSALLNQNAFAGAILLLLPVAARARDHALTALLMLCLWWSRSVGAWLGLSAALLLHRRAVGAPAFWFGAAVGFVGAIAAYAKLQSPEVLHRLAWWEAAWRMSAAAPATGLGSGAFAYALPAFLPERPDLSSLYAHQHFLETAAERGWPFLLLWTGGLAAVLWRAPAAYRFGPVAALVHGLVDYPLSVPAVFWLFCVSCALASPETREAANLPGRFKLAVMAGILALAAAAARPVWRRWSADRLRESARAAAESRDWGGAEDRLARSERLVEHPEAARLRAEIVLAAAGDDPARADLERAAEHLERAARLDPFRASTRELLAGVRARAAVAR